MTNSQGKKQIESCATHLQSWTSGIHSFHVKKEEQKYIIIFHSTENIRDKQKKYTESFREILDYCFDEYLLESEITDGLLKITITPF